MRKFITRKFSMNRWCVMPDIDELFYYPNHKLVSLKEFLHYLNKGKYNAVLTQMLDMYFGRTLKDIKEGLESRSMSIESHRSFEVDSIDRRPIPKGLKNKISNSSLKLFYGGFRKRVFNVNPCLSKFALFKPGHPTYRVGQHLVTRATIADVSCALLHYKFTGGFEAKLESALAEENYYKGSLEYKQYSSTLKADADIVIHTDSTLRLDNFKILEDVEFWVLSQAYIDYCAAQKSSATS